AAGSRRSIPPHPTLRADICSGVLRKKRSWDQCRVHNRRFQPCRRSSHGSGDDLVVLKQCEVYLSWITPFIQGYVPNRSSRSKRSNRLIQPERLERLELFERIERCAYRAPPKISR